MNAATVNIALADNQIAMWWTTLGLGLVVVLVVILLLSLLTGIVRDIDRNVADVWQVATKVARNTTTTWQLTSTGTLTDALREEVHTHATLFQSSNGSNRGARV
ncbi:MAG: hypothetical protein WD794_14365 [Mycobacteriales bacterium]